MHGRLVEDEDLAAEVEPELAAEPGLGQLAGLADEVAVVGLELLLLAGVVGDEDDARLVGGADIVEGSVVDDRGLDAVVPVAPILAHALLGRAQVGVGGAPEAHEAAELLARPDNLGMGFPGHGR